MQLDENFHSTIHTVLDQLDAYAAACAERGYDSITVNAMVTQFHNVLMRDLDRKLSYLLRMTEAALG